MTRYVKDNRWKLIPEIAAAHNDLARLYRSARKDKPELGRLLFVRYRAAERSLKDSINKNVFGI